MSKPQTSTSKPPSPRPEIDSGVVSHFARRRSAKAAPAKPAMDAGTEKLLAELKATIEQLPELDATKVVQLHNRIVADEYKIDSRRLTEKLLNLESLLER